MPAVCALVREFRPQLVLSQLFTMELAAFTKAACGLRWCCLNLGYYFGPDSPRPFEAAFVGRTRYYIQQFLQGIGEADLVLHGTDSLFHPPPPALPRDHQYVGPLWWERPSEMPTYLDVPGAPWVLVTVSSNPQAGEMTLARTALQTLAAQPVRVVLTLTARHPRHELGPGPSNARIEPFVPHSAVLTHRRLLVSHAGMASWPKPCIPASPWCWCPGTRISRAWPHVRPPSGWRKSLRDTTSRSGSSQRPSTRCCGKEARQHQ